MPVVGHRHHYGIHIVARQNLAVVVVDVFRGELGSVPRLVFAQFVDVADSDHLYVLPGFALTCKGAKVRPTHAADPNAGDIDAVVRTYNARSRTRRDAGFYGLYGLSCGCLRAPLSRWWP